MQFKNKVSVEIKTHKWCFIVDHPGSLHLFVPWLNFLIVGDDIFTFTFIATSLPK